MGALLLKTRSAVAGEDWKEKVARVLVSQLARMGDLVQGLYLTRDLARMEGHRVSVLVDKRLGPLVRVLAPWIEEVYCLDLERYLRAFRGGSHWTGLWAPLADELRPLREAAFDRVINLNFGRLTGAVMEAIRPEGPIEGFHSCKEGLYGDPWSDFISRLVRTCRQWNRFHIVDVFRFHAAKRGPVRLLAHRPARPLSARTVVGVQVGTRCGKRTWSAEGFAEVIRMLCRESGCEVLLLGARGESELAEAIVRRSRCDRVRNLVGKTSVLDLPSILEGCDRFLSADTGPLHLACFLGIPSVGLFFGPASVFETGPYGAGHTVVQASVPCWPCPEDAPCTREPCGSRIDPRGVFEALEGRLSEPGRDVQRYTSGFVRDWAQFRPVPPRAATEDDVIAYLFWGAAADFLETAGDRLPPPGSSLSLLFDHYRLDRALLDAVRVRLDGLVLAGMTGRDRSRLLACLQGTWKLLSRMYDERLGEEPIPVAGATA